VPESEVRLAGAVGISYFGPGASSLVSVEWFGWSAAWGGADGPPKRLGYGQDTFWVMMRSCSVSRFPGLGDPVFRYAYGCAGGEVADGAEQVLEPADTQPPDNTRSSASSAKRADGSPAGGGIEMLAAWGAHSPVGHTS
jgi:hypothetical protein